MFKGRLFKKLSAPQRQSEQPPPPQQQQQSQLPVRSQLPQHTHPAPPLRSPPATQLPPPAQRPPPTQLPQHTQLNSQTQVSQVSQSSQPTQFCAVCYACKQGIKWQTKALYCALCDLTFCEKCRLCDPKHKNGITVIQYERFNLDSLAYKLTSTCFFCKASVMARWECATCKVSACCACIYNDFHMRSMRFVSGHLTGASTHRLLIAILPFHWQYLIRAAPEPPHLRCLEADPGVFTHCLRCSAVISLDSCAYTCRTCAVTYGYSQRLCSTCFEEMEHPHDHQFSRLSYKILPASQASDKGISFDCESCPEMATTPWDPKLEFGHSHKDLTLCMTKEISDYTRLRRFLTCASMKRSPLRLTAPIPICARCGHTLTYNSDVAVCLESGCKISFCSKCIEQGYAATHSHESKLTYLKLFQTGAVASLGFLAYSDVATLFGATKRSIITCSTCCAGDALIFFEGVFCADDTGSNFCGSGICVSCLAIDSSLSQLRCSCTKSRLIYNFGLRSDQVLTTKVPTAGDTIPGFHLRSCFRPDMLIYDNFPPTLEQPVRLLHLQPGTGSEQITFSLSAHELSSCPEYVALSYTWGEDQKFKIFKSVAGKTFLATENLTAALTQLRHPASPRTLWADAICINQDNLAEKTKQLENMHYIYHRAATVLVSLGEGKLAFNKTFSWIAEEPERLRRPAMQGTSQLPAGAEKMISQLGAAHPGVQAALRSAKLPPIPREVILGLSSIPDLPYFSRVWVLQEIFYARKLEVFYGPHFVAWDSLIRSFIEFCRSPAGLIKFDPLKGGPHVLDLFRAFPIPESLQMSAGGSTFPVQGGLQEPTRDGEEQMNKPTKSLLGLLLRFWSYNATEGKDKAYALLNVAKPHTVSVDLECSVPDAFKDVAHCIISGSENLNILTIPNCARETANKLPSWAPDWANYDRESMAMPLHQDYRAATRGEVKHMLKYTATRGSKVSQPVHRDGNVLHLSGYVVDDDHIVDAGPKMPYFDNRTLTARGETLVDCLLAWNRIAMHSPHITSQQALENAERAFCLTLCRGAFWVGDGDEGRTMHEFRTWRAALDSYRSPTAHGAQSVSAPELVGSGKLLFPAAAILSWRNYAFARTSKGLLLMGTGAFQNGDFVAMMRGCDFPMVVRASPGVSGQFRLVGAAYVHGIMDGTSWNEERCKPMAFV